MSEEQENRVIKELFLGPKAEFKEHLGIVGNSRIVFSGKFGSGKTTFLKYFFQNDPDSDSVKDKYEVVHLFPVNYSITATEDIFELIKYDIIINLISKDLLTYESYLRTVDIIPSFLKTKFGKTLGLLTPLLTAIPLIGKPLFEVSKKFPSLTEDFNEYKNEINEAAYQNPALIEHLNTLDERIGSLYESNLVTSKIQEVMDGIRNKGKESVLIIDDMDRIDPEHIFRVLNIFSAHFDENLFFKTELKNKFGFDKVVIVCDIENVRRIFRNRFGQEVDFSGYVDKFYSTGIFNFQNREQLIQFFKKYFGSFHFEAENIDKNYNGVFDRIGLNNFNAIVDISSALMQNDLLPIRKILHVGETLKIIRASIEYNEISFKWWNATYILIIPILIRIYDGIKNFFEVLEQIMKYNLVLKLERFTVNALFYIATCDQHRFEYKYPGTIIKFREQVFFVEKHSPAGAEGTFFKVYLNDEQIENQKEALFDDIEVREILYRASEFYKDLILIG